MKLDNLIKQIWLEVRSRIVKKGESNEDVNNIPILYEVRKVRRY